MRDLLDRQLAALTFADDATRTPPIVAVSAMLALHLLGLAAVVRYYQQPLWLALVLLAALLALPFLIYRLRGALLVETLAPLFFLYAILAARFVFVRGLNGTIPGYFDYNAPDLHSTFFRIEPWTIGAVGYTLAIQLRWLAGRAWSRVVNGSALVLMIAALTWASALYIGQRTRGVTGSDPFAYAQMGIDLATRGTPLHRFPLFESVAQLGIAWSPIVHTGYHVPIDARGDAPTVWPFGGSFAFAVAYRLIGEEGLYLVNPLASLLLLVATGWLAWELFYDQAGRGWIAALSVAILATSHTLLDWATVPMVDAQAALFSALAICFALRYRRRPRWVLPILCGIALGAAYFVRHTQLLIAPAIIILLWRNDLPRAARSRALFGAGLAALLVALPDLWYHQVVFGGSFNVASAEQNSFALSSALSTGASFLQQMLAAREFGWILPFVLYGAYRLARDQRVEFAALALWVVGLFAFHALYPALRPRDLLPEFAPVVVITAYGVVAFVATLWRGNSSTQRFAAAAGLFIAVFLLMIRVWNIVPLAWSAAPPAFGSMTSAQRASFDQIAALTPPSAVIGSSLNTGPIDLFAQRAAFHPALWTAAERDAFIAAMFRAERPVYLLDDSAETSVVRRDLATRYTLHPIAVLDVPLFGAVDGTPGALWEIQP